MGVYDVATVLRPAEVLLIVPPFAWADRPSLGLHLLQGIARRGGIETQVLYANLMFAAWFDETTHTTLSRIQHGLFLGERVFARAAYDTPPLGRDGAAGLPPKLDALRASYARAGMAFPANALDVLRQIEGKIDGWLDTFCAQIAARYRIVGCTSSFEQNAGAIAILRRVKAANPAVITLLGGANCEDEMADGVRTLTTAVDHVFSGESEETFAELLAAVRTGGERPPIYRGTPARDLDALPVPDYADYYAQLAAFLPASALHVKGCTCLTYETSRGCWWGEKSHCTFCGLNGQGMAFRMKSPDRVIGELRELLATHPVADPGELRLTTGGTLQGRRAAPKKLVALTDNIMPHSYFRTLLPRLASELPGVTLMYEQKANLTLAQCEQLVAAGISEIQPGIEALSTGLLKLMSKGTTAAQNIALLRYAKIAGLYLYWNLLYAFPNDELAFYEETIELMPLLVHLQPPVSPCQVIFDRFSPYFDHPDEHGIRELRPLPFYAEVLPATADVAKVAYHFEGTCTTALAGHGDVLQRLGAALTAWRQAFHSGTPPRCEITRVAPGRFELIDTRGLPGVLERAELDEAQAAMALVARSQRGANREAYRWALDRKLVVERDGKLVPLAICDAALLHDLEARYRRAADSLVALAV